MSQAARYQDGQDLLALVSTLRFLLRSCADTAPSVVGFYATVRVNSITVPVTVVVRIMYINAFGTPINYEYTLDRLTQMYDLLGLPYQG
jgi:hypothetical protein